MIRTEAELVQPVLHTREVLCEAGLVTTLAPSSYWTASAEVVLPKFEKTQQGDMFMFADYDKSKDVLRVEFGGNSFDEYVRRSEGDSNITADDLRHLFIGHAIVHDLAIRGLRPERVSAFSEAVDEENGLFAELFLDGVVDQDEGYATVQEYFAGDVDKIAAVNVARFAIGVVYESFERVDKGFQHRVTTHFRAEIEETLATASQYQQMAMVRFHKTPEQARRLFVEQINSLKLAAAYPKSQTDVQRFLTIYE